MPRLSGRGGGRQRHPDQENTHNSFRIWNHPQNHFHPLSHNYRSRIQPIRKNRTPEIIEAHMPDPKGSTPVTGQPIMPRLEQTLCKLIKTMFVSRLNFAKNSDVGSTILRASCKGGVLTQHPKNRPHPFCEHMPVIAPPTHAPSLMCISRNLCICSFFRNYQLVLYFRPPLY